MPFSLLQPLAAVPLAFIDTETTGISTQDGHRVIELGIVRVEGGRVCAEYQQLIDPQRWVSPGITALTGISRDMLNGQPRFADQLPAALRLLEGAALIGHNVGFDLGFLHSELRHAGMELAHVLDVRTPILDTVRIARRRFGRGGNALRRLAARLGIDSVSAHRALADAHTTRLVLEQLLAPLAQWQTTLADAMIAQGGPIGLQDTGQHDSQLPVELAEALELHRPVEMEYLDANQQRTHRVIEARSLRRFKGEMVLVAHCRLRNAERYFKIDRIVHLSRIEEPPA
jgi:DNA polymerase III epsilon subunit family exonuclease